MVPGPDAQENWHSGEPYLSCAFMSTWCSSKYPQFKKHVDRREQGTHFVRTFAHGQFNHYLLIGFHVSGTELEFSASWFNASPIGMQAPQGPAELNWPRWMLQGGRKNLTSTQYGSWENEEPQTRHWLSVRPIFAPTTVILWLRNCVCAQPAWLSSWTST